MNRKNFYIVLFCVIVAALGFSFAAQLRTQTIFEQTCPDGNCETIIKEYEYLPIEDDYSEDQSPTSVSDDTIVIQKMAVIAGENVETNKDAIYNRSVFMAGMNVAAQQLDTNSTVFAAGLKVVANGKQQSIAAAGQSVVLDSVTHQEAYLAGSEVELTKNSSVRDLFAAGETVKLRGVVRGDSYIGAQNIILEDATILGDANFAAANIEFKGNSTIHGTLRYDSSAKVMSLDKSKVGGIASYIVPDATHDVWFIVFTYAARICSIISSVAIFAVFLIRICNKQYERLLANKSAIKDFGIGLISLIVVPSALVLMFAFEFLTLINCILILLAVLAALVSVGIVAIRIGKFVDANVLKSKTTTQYQVAMLGAITFALICALPIVGGTFAFILWVAGFGYIVGELIHLYVAKKPGKKAIKSNKK